MYFLVYIIFIIEIKDRNIYFICRIIFYYGVFWYSNILVLIVFFNRLVCEINYKYI